MNARKLKEAAEKNKVTAAPLREIVPVRQPESTDILAQTTDEARENWDNILTIITRLNGGKVRRTLDTGEPVKALDAQQLTELAAALNGYTERFHKSMLSLSVFGK